jgi:hypothetical protein
MQNSTDLQMINEYKSTNRIAKKQAIETELYTKYMPLIKHYAKRYETISSYEDNCQEAYFIMRKALDYVNPEKIYNKEAYSFGVTFKDYLKGYFSCEAKQEIPSTELIEETVVDNPLPSIEFEEAFLSWYKNLNKLEQRIFNYLEKGFQRKEIAVKLKMKNTANLTYHTNKLQKSYVEYMNKCGFSILTA